MRTLITFVLFIALVGCSTKTEQVSASDIALEGVFPMVGDQVFAGQELLTPKQIEEMKIVSLIVMELKPGIRELEEKSDRLNLFKVEGKTRTNEFKKLDEEFWRQADAVGGLIKYIEYLKDNFYKRYPEDREKADSPLKSAANIQSVK